MPPTTDDFEVENVKITFFIMLGSAKNKKTWYIGEVAAKKRSMKTGRGEQGGLFLQGREGSGEQSQKREEGGLASRRAKAHR